MSDAVLKPLMIGHGLEVPMPVILLGVIGGVIAYGLVGLFIGAVLLAVGYVLFREWLDAPRPHLLATLARLQGELLAAGLLTAPTPFEPLLRWPSRLGSSACRR